MIYASFFLVFGALLFLGPESPKFLVTQDKYDEALSVLQDIYAGNKGKRPDEYPVSIHFCIFVLKILGMLNIVVVIITID